MKTLLWLLLKAAIFFLLFTFALGNRHEAVLYFLPGQALAMPMVVVVLGCFALGVLLGVLVMLPRWWQLRRLARQAQQTAGLPVAVPAAATQAQAPVHAADLGRHMTDAAISHPYES
ncbi:MAG: LapA family protein [Brachymonas sp.]|nr:LapA family protein [Brachymonas sp.]